MRATIAPLLLAGICGYGASAAGVVRGVNLGGWFVTEPWMSPSLFSDTDTVDEWSLCLALGKDKCQSTMDYHYDTYYTQDDFKQIKQAGLTAVRIPLGHWSVDLADYEPYVKGAYPRLVRAVQWARDLGLNVFLDMHGVPGSQNGWEESGRVGPIGFPDNSSNTDRTLKVLKNLTEEFSKDIYKGTVTNIELLNEPLLDFDPLREFYTAGAGVVGAGNSSGINVTISDGFFQPHSWANYDPYNMAADKPAEYMTLDTHQFWAFPPLNTLSESEVLEQICTFGKFMKKPNVTGIPPTLVGEWSLSTGVTGNSTSNTEKDQAKRTWFRKLFEAQNAAFTPNGEGQASIGWYFWSWRTEYDIDAWSYRKGIEDGYIPSDISDPSTYIFPIRDDGCIDPDFKYTADPIVTSTPMPSSSSSTSSSASESSSKGAAVAAFVPLPGSWWTLASVFFGATYIV